jgi:hypothetical protein
MGTANLQLVAIAVVHIVELLLLSFFIVRFIVVEVEHHGFSKLLRNIFVLTTIFGSVSSLAFMISYLFYFLPFSGLISPGLTWPEFQAVVGFCYIFMFLAVDAHILLLYLRTGAVSVTSPKFLKFVKVLVGIYFASELASFVATIPLFIFSVNSTENLRANEAYEFLSILCGISMSLVDVLSAVSFALYVRSVNSSLTGSQVSLVVNNKACQSNLIARSGLWIALIASLGTGFLAGRQLLTNQMFQFWCELGLSSVITIVAILWMILKIKIDLLGKQHEKNLTANHKKDKLLASMADIKHPEKSKEDVESSLSPRRSLSNASKYEGLSNRIPE